MFLSLTVRLQRRYTYTFIIHKASHRSRVPGGRRPPQIPRERSFFCILVPKQTWMETSGFRRHLQRKFCRKKTKKALKWNAGWGEILGGGTRVGNMGIGNWMNPDCCSSCLFVGISPSRDGVCDVVGHGRVAFKRCAVETWNLRFTWTEK